MKVLVADDDRKVREYVTGLLEKAGYQTYAAKSGFEAIRIVEEVRPEIILADGLMPEMHGFEVARFVRNIGAGYRPAIILMSAIYKSSKYQLEAKFKYGVDRYLVKPASDELILETVGQAALAQELQASQHADAK